LNPWLLLLDLLGWFVLALVVVIFTVVIVGLIRGMFRKRKPDTTAILSSKERK